MTTPASVIALAEREVGYIEQGGADGRSGNITKFGAWFGWNGAPWCAMFLSYKFAEAGMPITGGQTSRGFASCELWLEWAKRMGTFTRTGRGRFYPGDVAFCQFDSDLAADHVFLITDTKSDSVLSVEGNTSPTNKGSQNNGGGVYQRERPLSVIIGVWHPPYEQLPAPPAPLAAVSSWPGRYLLLSSPHMRGNDVRALQRQMNRWGSKLAVDGDFGRATSDAVRWWQTAFHLPADGVVGPRTWQTFFAR